jgi:hypothetical protein
VQKFKLSENFMWTFMEFCGILWTFVDFCGFLWILVLNYFINLENQKFIF